MILQWRPMTIPGMAPEVAAAAQERVHEVLTSWEGTPYMKGNRRKGAGVDCVRFVVSVLDELGRTQPKPIPDVPQDASLHDRRMAVGAVKRIMDTYGPAAKVPVGEPVEPGDTLVVGPARGGPGHAMFVGVRGIWESTPPCVQRIGLHVGLGQRLFRVYRSSHRAAWAGEMAWQR